MPTTENDRLNLGQPVLQNPSLPDHDRRKDAGMHAAIPEETSAQETLDVDLELMDNSEEPPDQEFGEILQAGTKSNGGRIPVDPNNKLTSDGDPSGVGDEDPEDRGESTVDDYDGDKH
jgi:hypothetical protein